MKVTIQPLGKRKNGDKRIKAVIPIPGSKSHTIRGILIASLAAGESLLRRPLRSADTVSCITACRALGAEITEETDGKTGEYLLRIRGGDRRLPAAEEARGGRNR